ncbi:hypothetical protein GCM10023318_47970 [Nocardia callitridis]|uniref:Uncharacterized protein n=1 Tax=Nocardia callitridis TaxID=648753 RepID=A0ABP9KT14_9NOCA
MAVAATWSTTEPRGSKEGPDSCQMYCTAAIWFRERLRNKGSGAPSRSKSPVSAATKPAR